MLSTFRSIYIGSNPSFFNQVLTKPGPEKVGPPRIIRHGSLAAKKINPKY
jgi:hypothetical protein